MVGLGSNLSVSAAPQVEEMREHAQYFRFLRGEREIVDWLVERRGFDPRDPIG
jgi:hypothetical protein